MLWTRHVHPRGSQDAGDSRVISGCPPTHSGSWRPLLFSSASCLLQGPSHYSPVVLLDSALTSCGMGVADGTVGTGNVSGRPWHFQA